MMGIKYKKINCPIADGSSPSCPAGVAACELVGGEARERGSPTGQLSVTQDNKLYLMYRSDQTQPGCDSPPTTSITFICPSRGGVSTHG